MTGDRPTTPGWHCHRCRSTSCRQRADSDTDHVGRVEYRPLLLTQPSSVPWLWSHTHWCPSQRPQEVIRVDGSANPTMPKNPTQYPYLRLSQGVIAWPQVRRIPTKTSKNRTKKKKIPESSRKAEESKKAAQKIRKNRRLRWAGLANQR